MRWSMGISSQLIDPSEKNRKWGDLLRLSAKCKGNLQFWWRILPVSWFRHFVVQLPLPTLHKCSAEDTKTSRNISMHYICMDSEDLSTLSYLMVTKIHLSACTHKNSTSMTT
jgi:hypothetical protein